MSDTCKHGQSMFCVDCFTDAIEPPPPPASLVVSMTSDAAKEATVKLVEELLAEVYTDAGIEIWWSARNRNFGGETPLVLLVGDDEDRARLVAEVERLSGGAW